MLVAASLITVTLLTLLSTAHTSPESSTISKGLIHGDDRLPILDNDIDFESTAAPAEKTSKSFFNKNYILLKKFKFISSQKSGTNKSSGARSYETKPRLGKNGDGQRPLSPIILVPGYGGSRLQAKRNKTTVKSYFCEKESDWSNVWIDLKLMLPYKIECLIEDFRLEFDPSTNTTHNTQGVQIRVRDPDDILSVEYLNDIHLSSFAYFAPIIKRLVHSFGYERNLNIRGAPYDFRKAPNELGDFFAWMKSTCEHLYKQFNRGVTFICHSMGCNNVLYFLQNQPQRWKDRYVLRIISLAAPWAGSMQALRATAFGDNLGLPYLFDEAELKIVQQSVPSTMYLFPNEEVFKDTPLIRTNVRPRAPLKSAGLKQAQTNETQSTTGDPTKISETYTAKDMKRFFEDIKHPDGYLMWLNTKNLLRSLKAPGVEVWCLYGEGHPTLGRMEFWGDFPNSQEEDLNDDGDGTVSVQSASYCIHWSKKQKQPIASRGFYASHIDMMKDGGVLDSIERIMEQNIDKKVRS